MKIKLFVKTLLVLFVLIFSVISILVFWLNSPTNKIPITGFEFQIKKGYTSYTVATILHNNGYIRSRLFFLLVIKLFNLEKDLKIGYFFIEPDSSTMKIIYMNILIL